MQKLCKNYERIRVANGEKTYKIDDIVQLSAEHRAELIAFCDEFGRYALKLNLSGSTYTHVVALLIFAIKHDNMFIHSDLFDNAYVAETPNYGSDNSNTIRIILIPNKTIISVFLQIITNEDIRNPIC